METGKSVRLALLSALAMFFSGIGIVFISPDQSEWTAIGVIVCLLGVLLWVCASIGSRSALIAGPFQEEHLVRPKNYRKSALILSSGLILLTIPAFLPYAPQGPFNPVNYTRLPGMSLEQHRWTAIVEPFFAPLKIVAGAPDFKIAAVVSLIWLFLGAMAWGMFSEFRRGKKFFAALRRGLETLSSPL